MTNIYELALTSTDGRKRKTLAWLPTEAIKQELYKTCRKRGLTVKLLTPNF